MNKLWWCFWSCSALGLIACGGDDEASCDEPGHACTWLGLPGESGFNGDGKDRLETKMYWSMDMTFGPDGTPWFIDWNNHMVRRVLPDQTVETVLGWTDPPFPGDGGPGETMPGGALGTEVQLNHPTDLAIDTDGTVLVMAWHNHKLRRLDPMTLFVSIECGAVAAVAGAGVQGDRSSQGDGGPALMANLNLEAGSNPEPSGGLALDGTRLYFADTLANRIRVIDLASDPPTIDAYAGTGETGLSGDGGPALAATLYHPRDLEIGPDGDLYVADTDNSVIRAISAGPPSPWLERSPCTPVPAMVLIMPAASISRMRQFCWSMM